MWIKFFGGLIKMIKCIVLQQDGTVCGCEADYVIFGQSLCEGHSKDMHFTAVQITENYIAHLQAINNLMREKYGRSEGS